MNTEYNLHCPFDAEKHKAKYVNYLEVVIDENGTVMYAVPSHQEKGVQLACDKLRVSRDELNDMCPPEYYFDFMTWLSKIAGIVFVWEGFCSFGKINRKQVATLRKLKMCGLYKGMIPDMSKTKGEKQKNG